MPIDAPAAAGSPRGKTLRRRSRPRVPCRARNGPAWGAALLLLAGPVPGVGQPLELGPCRVAAGRIPARCGDLSVPENRLDFDGREIRIAVVVLPATGEVREPDPIFVLHGGPGAAARYLVPMFVADPLRQSRDFVFVDQRGTGRSQRISCEPESLEALLRAVLTFEVGVSDCRIDEAAPAHYRTSAAVDDLDEVRAALGYAQLNLWGGSYGTRAALEYMRRYPARVRTALLDGVAPSNMYIPLHFPAGAEAALDLTIEDCEAQPRCAEAFPRTRTVLERAMERLAERPQRMSLVDPRNERRAEISFTRDYLAAAVLFALYNAGTAAQLPSWIHEAGAGNLDPIARFAVGFAVGLASQFSFGSTLAVACPEDVARYTPREARRAAEGSFLGSQLALNLSDACEDWPAAAPIDPEFWLPFASDLPILMLSGEGDPVTPPRWADGLLNSLSNARHVVFPDRGHGATSSTCGRRLFREFVASGTAIGLDLACALESRRPEFGGLSR